MPNYAFVCTHCGYGKEKFIAIKDYDEPECPRCGMSMEWNPREQTITKPFKEFTTTHIDGKPITIKSLHELRNLERSRGVNFPAYGGSMLNVDVENHKNYTDESGVTHRG